MFPLIIIKVLILKITDEYNTTTPSCYKISCKKYSVILNTFAWLPGLLWAKLNLCHIVLEWNIFMKSSAGRVKL